jgi:cadmium resistance protein CadD (predicted permease)
MGSWAVLGRAAAAFTVTNVDAFVVLTLLFATSRSTGLSRPAQILAGQFLGFAAWVGVSVLAAAGLRLAPDEGAQPAPRTPARPHLPTCPPPARCQWPA